MLLSLSLSTQDSGRTPTTAVSIRTGASATPRHDPSPPGPESVLVEPRQSRVQNAIYRVQSVHLPTSPPIQYTSGARDTPAPRYPLSHAGCTVRIRIAGRSEQRTGQGTGDPPGRGRNMWWGTQTHTGHRTAQGHVYVRGTRSYT
ncbi:hypothetical protein DENSPDRAFT_228024 [Dentipellis sp. KUC8613]|nr:hypothetical protein DENSPDRAFT_228024 [Dentipellis sp. KUC8613]